MFHIPISNPKEISSIIEALSESLNSKGNSSIQNIVNELNSQKESSSSQPNVFGVLFDKFMQQQEQEQKQQEQLPPKPHQNIVTKQSTRPMGHKNEYNYELVESSDKLIVYVDIPGVKKESSIISVDNDSLLHIQCERKPSDPCLNVLKSTVEYGTKFLNIQLKNISLIGNDITASYNDGVLVVKIPKKDNTKKSNIIKVL